MGEDPRWRGRASGLTDRRGERGVLDQLIDAVRAGGSRVLVVRGEPGVGKSALLDYLAGRASGCRVVRAAGVESEMELAFAGLHQLLAPVLDRLEGLPGPQQEALRTAFGLSSGPAPDRFLVGLAVLGLVSEVAGQRPLVCVVDDEQFRHPLARSAAYRSVSPRERQEVHGALAEVTDPAADPDRRAWHRAQAAPGPDEEVAAELERSAGRAEDRGGWLRRPRSWSGRRC